MLLTKIYQAIVSLPLKFLVKSKLLPEDPIKDLKIDKESPIFYVLQRRSTSSFVMLKEKALQMGLPEPKLIENTTNPLENGSVFFLQSKQILGLGGRPIKKYQEAFERLMSKQKESPKTKLQLIPFSIYWGRNPGKENSIFRLLFTDTESANPLRKFLLFLFQGRNSFVRVAPPVNLHKIIDSTSNQSLLVTKLTRTLRVHFSRLRRAAMGPLLTNRGQVVTNLVVSDNVKGAIQREAKTKKISETKARKLAEKYAKEIASAYSYKMVRFLESMLSHLWNKIYDGVEVKNAEAVRELAATHEILYVPSHRSHIDYLLLSYTLYHEGLVAPHIAAGINLNFWPAGPILRRGGAFFLRRSFGGNKLYTAVFNEYIFQLMDRGFPIKFFPEGGRSRTGRLLQPKTGLMAMTMQAMLRGTRKPVAIVPVYIGYEKLFEGKSYINELRGAKKQKESLGQLFGIRKTLKQNFGKVYLNFAEPIQLNDYLDKKQPDWQSYKGQVGAKPSWLSPQVTELAEEVMQNINASAKVNAISLVALVLLSTDRVAIGKNELTEQITLLLDLAKKAPYGNYIQLPNSQTDRIIEEAKSLGVIYEVDNPIGDIISTDEESALLLTYYRNNIIHIYITYSLVASCFINYLVRTRQDVQTIVARIFPLIKKELFIKWPLEDLECRVNEVIDALIGQNLLNEDDGSLLRPHDSSKEFEQLLCLAQLVRPMLLRYGILLTLLSHQLNDKNISRGQLEKHSQQIAQRLAALYSINAPESFDKNLFKIAISVLRDSKLIKTGEGNSLSVAPEITDLTQTVLENVNPGSRHIMQKTAGWAEQFWTE